MDILWRKSGMMMIIFSGVLAVCFGPITKECSGATKYPHQSSTNLEMEVHTPVTAYHVSKNMLFHMFSFLKDAASRYDRILGNPWHFATILFAQYLIFSGQMTTKCYDLLVLTDLVSPQVAIVDWRAENCYSCLFHPNRDFLKKCQFYQPTITHSTDILFAWHNISS
ncbi:hypothetical protein ACJX0J_024225 [Zea mays]